MKITVTTVYEGITPRSLREFMHSVFDSTWAAKEFPPEQIAEMKKDFAQGEEVVAKTHNPLNPKESATTTWKVEV